MRENKLGRHVKSQNSSGPRMTAEVMIQAFIMACTRRKPHSGAGGDLRIPGGVLQPQMTSFNARIANTGRIRTEGRNAARYENES